MSSYGLIALKFVVGMIMMILQINLLGKVEFARNTPLNQIQNYVLGGIIGGVIYNPAITIWQFLIILLLWSLIVAIVKFGREHSRWLRLLIEGRPVMLVADGQLRPTACLQVGLSANQLMEQLRNSGITTLSQVKSAVMETNGQLTVIEKDAANLKLPLISDGQLNVEVLSLIGKSPTWVQTQLQAAGLQRVEQVFVGEYVNGELWVVPYPQSA